MALTPRQRMFCVEYARCGNASEAYRLAYPDATGERSAGVAGSRLLKSVEIDEYVGKLREQMTGEMSADALEVREYWTSVMRGDARVDVVEAEVNEAGELETKTYQRPPTQAERMRASEQLAKALGMFTEKVDVTSGGAAFGPRPWLPPRDDGVESPEDVAEQVPASEAVKPAKPAKPAKKAVKKAAKKAAAKGGKAKRNG